MGKKKYSKARRMKISRAQQGKNNSFYGKHHTANVRRKIKLATQGENNPMYGKHHTEEARKKISLARRRYLARIRK